MINRPHYQPTTHEPNEQEPADVITNLKTTTNPHHTFLTSGNVARLLGCSLRAASTFLDKHGDLVAKWGRNPAKQHRRITRANFFVLLDREGITPQQIGLNAERLGWIGTPLEQYLSPDDLRTGTVSVIVDVMRGELSSVAAFRDHRLTTPELISLAEAVSNRYCRFAAILPDDAGIEARKSNHVWLFLESSRTNLDHVMLWLRGIEVARPGSVAVADVGGIDE